MLPKIRKFIAVLITAWCSWLALVGSVYEIVTNPDHLLSLRVLYASLLASVLIALTVVIEYDEEA